MTPGDDLKAFLAQMGLEGATTRPHLQPEVEHPLTAQVDKMEAWLIREIESPEALQEYRRALNLLRVGTLYDPYLSDAPGGVLGSIESLISLYIRIVVDTVSSGEVNLEEVTMSLLRLSNMSLRLGYAFHAMEDDGRWQDLDPTPLPTPEL